MFAFIHNDGCCYCSTKVMHSSIQNGTGYFYDVRAECILCGETSYGLKVALNKVFDIDYEVVRFIQLCMKDA